MMDFIPGDPERETFAHLKIVSGVKKLGDFPSPSFFGDNFIRINIPLFYGALF